MSKSRSSKSKQTSSQSASVNAETDATAPAAVRGRNSGRTRKLLAVAAVVLFVVVAGGVVFGDWWTTLPDDVTANYVGRQSCLQCHTQQTQDWTGSHHDLAMDLATDETVLADFNDATLTHHDVESTMFRDGDKFMVRTEGPDGKLGDFQVKYVFGVTPLQQYMVEFDRTDNMSRDEIARLQVLRLCWDTLNKKWFY